MKRALLAAGAVALGLVSGCSGITNGDCQADQPASFSIQIADSATKQFIAVGAQIIARHSGTTDSVVVQGASGANDAGAAAVGNVSGTFDLTVRKVGYRDWTRSTIVVGRNTCGQTATQIMTVYLQPL